MEKNLNILKSSSSIIIRFVVAIVALVVSVNHHFYLFHQFAETPDNRVSMIHMGCLRKPEFIYMM